MNALEVLKNMTSICIVGLSHSGQAFSFYAYKDPNIPLTKKKGGIFEFEDYSTCGVETGEVVCNGHNMHIGHIKRDKTLMIRFPELALLEINKLNSCLEIRRHKDPGVSIRIQGWRYSRSPLVVSCVANKICLGENPLSLFESSWKLIRWYKKIFTRKQRIVIILPEWVAITNHAQDFTTRQRKELSIATCLA